MGYRRENGHLTILFKVGCSTFELVVVDSPTMLVQIDDLPQYDGVDMLERDRQVLEEEEVLEGEYLRDDGEEDEGPLDSGRSSQLKVASRLFLREVLQVIIVL